MKSHRRARVSEVIREVTSETILFQIKDPRVKGVTVTRAEVSGDLQHAKVYVSVMGSQRDQVVCLRGLHQAAGFVQSRLADRMKSRFVPIITFVEDVGVKNSIEVNRLIREALALSAGDNPESTEGANANPDDPTHADEDDENEDEDDGDENDEDDVDEDEDQDGDDSPALKADESEAGIREVGGPETSGPKTP